jgi:hypothetical protein
MGFCNCFFLNMGFSVVTLLLLLMGFSVLSVEGTLSVRFEPFEAGVPGSP